MKKVKQKWPTVAQVAGALFWKTGEIEGPTRCALYVWPTRTTDETLPHWAIEIGAPGTEYVGAFAGCGHLRREQSYTACKETARDLLAHAKQGPVWGHKEVANGQAV